MNIKSLIGTAMGRTTIFAFVFALLYPLVITLVEQKLLSKRIYRRVRFVLLIAYSFGIIYLTLIDRDVTKRSANLMPFWSYGHWSNVEYRWIIFMNILVFVPFGFMLPWSAEMKFWQTALIGFVFSVCIEALQYILKVGLCEFDDVFNNTLGTVLGYGYWRCPFERMILLTITNKPLFSDKNWLLLIQKSPFTWGFALQ